jgi:hypothetical protein
MQYKSDTVTIVCYCSRTGDYAFRVSSVQSTYQIGVDYLVSQGLCCKVFDSTDVLIYTVGAVFD